MNAVTEVLLAGREHDEPALAVWSIAPGALLVLGRSRTEVPDTGMVLADGRQADRGPFRAVAWKLAGDGGHAFLAAIRLPARTEPRSGQVLGLHGKGRVAAVVRLPDSFGGPEAFASEAAGLAGAKAAAIARFLLDSFTPEAMQRVPEARLLIAGFLGAVAVADGCVEMMAAVPDGCVLLQGWGASTGDAELVLAGSQIARFAAQEGTFARPDIAAPATGIALLLAPDAVGALSGLEHVYVIGERIHRRGLVDRRLLGPEDSQGHLAALQRGLRCSAPMAQAIRAALRPRYAGRDTLVEDGRYVRAAVDTAVAAPGVGAYLAGWLYDPAAQIASVTLRGTAGYGARLDSGWVRVPRADVTDAFRHSGLPAPSHDSHGFVASAPAGAQAGETLFLEIAYRDGHLGFVPLNTVDPAAAGIRARLLGTIDLFKPSGLPAVERHLAPFFARLSGHLPALEAMPVRLGPVQRPEALVVPLAAAVPPRALLSGLLREPLGGDEQLVLVCGPDWDGAALDALLGLCAFQGVGATVLQAGAADAVSALHATLAHTKAQRLLLADPALAALTPDWRAALHGALAAAPDAAAACPTVLYEDFSVRYAGMEAPALLDGAPYVDFAGPLTGMPAALAGEGAPRPAGLGTLRCCLIRAGAVADLPRPGLATPAGDEAAFFLDLAARRRRCLFVPGVQVVVPDIADTAAHPDMVARLVDGWTLRARLGADTTEAACAR